MNSAWRERHGRRQLDLEQDYAAAWQEWESSGEQVAWEATVLDGAPR
ncbi:MAG: hypothetical protein ACRC35_04970 [Angustibacter sp.]